MACVESGPLINVESEMEEGEIVDDIDDLSDISSEEEFLLRQRLEVLENYNNVLERKKSKRSSVGSGDKVRNKNALLRDLSEISTSELEDACGGNNNKKIRNSKSLKLHNRQKNKKEFDDAVSLKKKSIRKKKKLPLKVTSESSEESDDEYRNKRRKLANAVAVNKDKYDKSSLKSRLNNMIHGFKTAPLKIDKQTETEQIQTDIDVFLLSDSLPKQIVTSSNTENIITKECSVQVNDYVDLCTEEEKKNSSNDVSIDVVDGVCYGTDVGVTDNKQVEINESDEDLELLRQHVLKTKSSKVKQTVEKVPPKKNNSEDEDSDTAELRLICLKSAILKKAIEMKQKQKLKKRLSQSTSLQDELLLEEQLLQSDNNTDIESVDMDIGSDAEDKSKELDHVFKEKQAEENIKLEGDKLPKQDELDEDEDLLRAKLLTSLSKNLPHLVDPQIINSLEKDSPQKPPPVIKKPPVQPAPEEKKIIINLGESDSEVEHEATKNLTKMHMKLSEQLDFQQKLDMFLKSARMEVEGNKLPDVVLKPNLPKTPTKYVAKAVNHLPKSEQNEYKSLVKRMAELEKIKQARQSAMNIVNNAGINTKDTLKPRNVTIEAVKAVQINKIEEQIATSRKKIQEESAKILKLREEATKLAQKYKIVATELRNLATAITFNKKEQKLSQNRLTKIRLQHQSLLKSSNNNKHSTRNMSNINRVNNKINATNRLQKENNPVKDEYKNPQVLKTLKISVVNDFKETTENITTTNPRLSIEIDVSNNKKTVTVPKNEDRIADAQVECSSLEKIIEVPPDINKNDNLIKVNKNDDYQSPLQALQSASWNEDPNGILCPFEVGGNCKDADCKYMHPKNLSIQ